MDVNCNVCGEPWEEETEPVFVMQTRGGAYRTVVQIHPTRQTYDATDYTSGRSSGGATGYSRKQMLEWLAKKKFYALQYDKRTFKATVDEIGFDRFYQSVTKTAKEASLKQFQSMCRNIVRKEGGE